MELSYFALIGAPNCGKTVLFNGLTGSHAKVANYPGVTVDKREGAFLDDEAVRIIDLPGTYSLRTTSPDEAVAKDVMVGKMGIPPDAIIAVADATNLRMTLRMILELKTLGLPMVVSLNLSDVARKRGLNIDAAKLSELLDAPVLETVAVSASGVQAVREAVAKLPRKRSFPANPASAERTLDALDSDKLYQEVDLICTSGTHPDDAARMAQKTRRHRAAPRLGHDYAAGHPVYGVPSGLHMGGADYGRHRRWLYRAGRMDRRQHGAGHPQRFAGQRRHCRFGQRVGVPAADYDFVCLYPAIGRLRLSAACSLPAG